MDATQKNGLIWIWQSLARLFAAIRHVAQHVQVRRNVRSLRVCESVALGDRRFLLLVQCGERRYLVGAAAQSITLLDRLERSDNTELDEIVSGQQTPWKGLH